MGRQGARRPQGGAGRACLSSARGSLSPRLLASSPAATAPRLHPARQLGRQREGWGLALSVHGFHARLRRRAPWGPERAAGSAARSSAPRPSPTRLPPCRACGQPSDACRARAMGQAESRAAGLQGEGAPSPQRTETQTSGRRSHAGMPGYKPRHALRPWGGGRVGCECGAGHGPGAQVCTGGCAEADPPEQDQHRGAVRGGVGCVHGEGRTGLLEQRRTQEDGNPRAVEGWGVHLANPGGQVAPAAKALRSAAKCECDRPLPGALGHPCAPQTSRFTRRPAGLHCRPKATRWQQRASKLGLGATGGREPPPQAGQLAPAPRGDGHLSPGTRASRDLPAPSSSFLKHRQGARITGQLRAAGRSCRGREGR